jgi:hypothetical protein
MYLFDIPIKRIADIRFFDETTSETIGFFVASYWAIPINMKKGDASVLIDWNDGQYNHSTEFRFNGILNGYKASNRANALRNSLIKMTKVQ